MKSHQIYHKRVSGAILSLVDPDSFVPVRLTAKALNDDSCWEEDDADFEATLPGYDLCSMGDDDSF